MDPILLGEGLAVLMFFGVLGTLLIVFGGLRFVDAAPQMVPMWWVVLIVVIGTALFFVFAMTTVVRARFSTQTIGREHLIGRFGEALGSIAPDGIVRIDDAEWQARSTRVSGIGAGDRVVVAGVDGITLQVDKAPDELP